MEAIISYLCKVATFQKEVTYSEWCVATNTLRPLFFVKFNINLYTPLELTGIDGSHVY